jgi:hypothetical protein
MRLEELYSITRWEFAEDLIFELNGVPITLSIKGVLIGKDEGKGYGFSFFEISEREFVVAVQMRGFTVYVAIETDGELDEEDFAEIGSVLLEHLSPKIALLVTKAEKSYSGRADLLLDDGMSQGLKEFFYSLLAKYRNGKSPYEQTEVA